MMRWKCPKCGHVKEIENPRITASMCVPCLTWRDCVFELRAKVTLEGQQQMMEVRGTVKGILVEEATHHECLFSAGGEEMN